MGVSFKVSKVGRRYRPEILQVESEDSENGSSNEPQLKENEAEALGEEHITDRSDGFAKPRVLPPVSEDLEVSCSVNLFTNGFSVGRATELYNNAPKLQPYDRASEKLFSAIECGCLPGDLFDDIPCKYINGAIVCEIRDYRNCYPYMGNAAAPAKDCPTIHKVLLQMGMENVVKDISSISNNSWTYEDLLKVESRILKALQLDLHLNPKPVLGRFCEEPMAKKLNLEIPWSWKKRKLTDAPTTELAFNNPFHGTYVPGNSLNQNSKSQFNLAFQNRGVTCTQRIVQGASYNSQENNVVQENILQSIHFPYLSNHQVIFSCNRTNLTDLNPSDFVSASRQCYRNHSCDSAEPSTLILGNRGSCDTQAIRGEPILSKPTGELLDFSQPQPLGSHAETILALDSQLRRRLAKQQLEAEKFLSESLNGNKNFSLISDNGRTAILGCLPTLKAELPTCNMRQGISETSDVPISDAGKNGNNFLSMDMRCNKFNVQQLQLDHSSPFSSVPVPPWSVQGNHVGKPAGQSMRTEANCQKRKASQNDQVSTGNGSTPVSSSLGVSFPKELSEPAKKESDSCFKGLNLNVGGSTSTNHMNKFNEKNLLEDTPKELSEPAKKESNSCFKGLNLKVGGSTSTNHMNQVNEKNLLEEDSCFPQPSGDECDPVLVRFANINIVTQRYGLNHRKHKSDNYLGRRPFSCMNPLVGFNIFNSKNDENSKDAIMDGNSLSKCFIDRSPDVSKTRTLTFICPPRINKGSKIPFIDNGDQKKLIIAERQYEGMTQARVLYGHEEEINSIDFPFPPTISTSRYAELFTTQFTSLMVREGYTLSTDHTKPTPVSTSSAIPLVGSVEVTTPALMPLPSLQMLSPMSSSMSALDIRQSLSQNFLSGDHVLPIGNTQSALKLSDGQLSAQLSSIQQHWLHTYYKRAPLHSQMQQRQRQPQYLQRKVMMGGFGVSGTIQLGGIQGIANKSLGSFNDVVDMETLTSLSMGGQISGIANMGQVNDLGSNITSFSASKQPFDGFTGPLAAVLESEEKVSRNGVFIQRDAAATPRQLSNILDMTLNLTNQQVPQPPLQQLHQHLPLLAQELQQTIRSPLLPTEQASLNEHTSSPPSQLCPLQFGQQPRLNLQQLGTRYPLSQQHIGGGNVVVGPDTLELSSQTRGSV